jgi:hypothetical protein
MALVPREAGAWKLCAFSPIVISSQTGSRRAISISSDPLRAGHPRRQVSSIRTSSRVLVAAASLRQLLLVAAVDASWGFATMINKLDTPEGIFPLEVWRFEKSLTK